MKVFILIAALAFLSILQAQPQILTQRVWQSDSLGAIHEMIPSTNGQYIIAGNIEEGTAGNVYIASVNEALDIQWEVVIDKGENERINSLRSDTNGGAWVLMYSETQTYVHTQFLLHYNASGKLLEEHSLENGVFIATDWVPIPQSEDFIAGVSISNKKDSISVGLLKINKEGKTQTVAKFLLPPQTRARSVVLLPLEDNTLVLAYSQVVQRDSFTMEDYRKPKNELVFIHCDYAGKQLAHSQLPVENKILTLKKTADRHIISMEEAYDEKKGGSKAWVRKIAPLTQTPIWSTSIHVQKDNTLIDCSEMPNHRYVFSVYSTGGGNYAVYPALVEMDREGNIGWTKVFRDGNLMTSCYPLANGRYLCVGSYSEDFLPQKKEHTYNYNPRKVKRKRNVIVLSEDACMWQVQNKGYGSDQAYAVAHAKGEGYFVAGINFEGNSIFLYKVDEAGKLIWAQRAGHWSASMEVPVDLCATEEGCILINNKDDIYLFNDYGGEVWKNDKWSYSHLSAILPAPKNHFWVAGSVWVEYPFRKLWLGKIKKDGTSVWEKELDFHSVLEVWDAIPTEDGGLVIANDKGEIGETVFQLMKISSSGDMIWQEEYPLGSKGMIKSVTATKDGGYAASGVVYQGGEYRARLLKTNAKGKVEWDTLLVPSTHDVFSCRVVADMSGEIILAATHEYDNYKAGSQIYVAKFSMKGEKIWEKFIGGTGSYEMNDMVISPDNNIILVGYTDYKTDTHDPDMVILKVKNAPNK